MSANNLRDLCLKENFACKVAGVKHLFVEIYVLIVLTLNQHSHSFLVCLFVLFTPIENVIFSLALVCLFDRL